MGRWNAQHRVAVNLGEFIAEPLHSHMQGDQKDEYRAGKKGSSRFLMLILFRDAHAISNESSGASSLRAGILDIQ